MSSNEKRFRISVDAMGGDFAPGEIVKGAIQAAREYDVEIILVGIKEELDKELSKHDIDGLPVTFVEATDRIIDGEQAAIAVMRKPNSSVALATRLVKEGKADAVISAGSTGAVMVSALQYLGPLPGIDRPIAGGPFLHFAPNTVVLDLGANVGCQPYQYVNFAVAGSVYVKCFMGIENPTVGLLNVGSEEGKGNDVSKEAYELLKKSGVNFIGNIEGMDIPAGKANVIVCDGFVGNILLKFAEGIGYAVSQWLKKELADRRPEEIDKITSKLRMMMSPATVLGGGPLWGVNGVVSVAHGNSKAEHVVGTVKQTILALESGFIDKLRSELENATEAINNKE